MVSTASLSDKLRREWRRLRTRYLLRTGAVDKIFGEYHRHNQWHGRVSVSGIGSDPEHTGVIVSRLPELFNEFEIASILDIPCGDFAWMKEVDLTGIDYIGADIVQPLVESNRKTHAGNNIQFKHWNILSDELPTVDLVLCRDCLVHFAFKDVFRALVNISRSGSKYVLATSFPKQRMNRDIKTGRWRPLNLEIAPFNLPQPERVICEECMHDQGLYGDKSLALWTVRDVLHRLD